MVCGGIFFDHNLIPKRLTPKRFHPRNFSKNVRTLFHLSCWTTLITNSVLLHWNCAESDVGTLVLLELLDIVENFIPIEPVQSDDIICACILSVRMQRKSLTCHSHKCQSHCIISTCNVTVIDTQHTIVTVLASANTDHTYLSMLLSNMFRTFSKAEIQTLRLSDCIPRF